MKIKKSILWLALIAAFVFIAFASRLIGCGNVLTETTTGPELTVLLPPVTAQIARELIFVTSGTNEISVYSVEASGNLSLIQAEPMALPVGINYTIGALPAIHPSGKFLYLQPKLNSWGAGDLGHIIIYGVDAAQGKLSLLDANATVPNIAPYAHLDIDPAGKYAYVPYEIFVYSPEVKIINGYNICSINDSTGALTVDQTEEIPLLLMDQSDRTLRIHPAGKYAYIISGVGGPVNPTAPITPEVIACAIDNTGLLSTLETVSTGPLPLIGDDHISSAIDPTGKNLFILERDSKQVVHLTIDQLTGRFSSSPEIIAISDKPNSIAFHPSGQMAYVLTSGGIYLYSIDPSSNAARFAKKIDVSFTFFGLIPANALTVNISVDPAGKFAYAVLSEDQFSLTAAGKIIAYSINPYGDLTKISEIPCANYPQAMLLWGK